MDLGNDLGYARARELILLRDLQSDPRVQRRASQYWVNKLISEYDPKLLDPLLIARHPDRSNWVVNGQHRYLMLDARFGQDHVIACDVIQTSGWEEDLLIAEKTNGKGQRHWGKNDTDIRNIMAGVPPWNDIARALDDQGFHIQLEPTPKGGTKDWRGINAYTALLVLHQKSPHLLLQTLHFVKRSWPGKFGSTTNDVLFRVSEFIDVCLKDTANNRLFAKAWSSGDLFVRFAGTEPKFLSANAAGMPYRLGKWRFVYAMIDYFNSCSVARGSKLQKPIF